MAMHVACKCHDSLRGNPISCGNETCRGNCQDLCHENATTRLVEKNFQSKPWISTRQILRGAMRVHTRKSEVINKRYCTQQGSIQVKTFTSNREFYTNLSLNSSLFRVHKTNKRLK